MCKELVMFEVFRAVRLIFWVLARRRLVDLISSPEDGYSIFRRKVGYLPTSLYGPKTRKDDIIMQST
jgi:hypothetical protein